VNFRFEKWGVRFHIGIGRTTKVQGVNSDLGDGYHFLMWDFDNVNEAALRRELSYIQDTFGLPDIHVLSTGLPDYYHAYCFARLKWREARAVIAATELVDRVYLTLGMMRGYFTLRFSDKRGRSISKAFTLPSDIPATVDAGEVVSFLEYTTKRR